MKNHVKRWKQSLYSSRRWRKRVEGALSEEKLVPERGKEVMKEIPT